MKNTQSRLAKFQVSNRKAQNTPAVRKVEAQLLEAGIRFIREKVFYAGHHHGYLVDFYLPKPMKVCIEVDGSYHIGREYYDSQKDAYLTDQRGFKVIRVTNDQVLEDGFNIQTLLSAGTHKGDVATVTEGAVLESSKAAMGG